ncbi:MAG: DUF11 domain-containing protein [Nitrospirae bacterium]|nr:DUF11 domain-containing protein [Nitrospirota bacterium]
MLKRIAVALLVVLASSFPAYAEKSDPLTLRTDGYLVQNVMKDGKPVEKLVELPKEVAPGEVISYTITGKNSAKKQLKDIDVVGAIPRGTAYIDKSVKGPADGSVQFSFDGGKNYGKQPLKEKVKGPDGKVEEKVVPVSRYTNIKVVAGRLEAGKEFSFSYRVQVK